MPYIYSTATCPTSYVKYETLKEESNRRGSSGYNKIIKQVKINGGHGIADRNLFTPQGVVTYVSEEDMEFLLQDENFQRHMKAGFMSYDKKKVEPSKKSLNMCNRDGSAPLTPKNFEKGKNYDGDFISYKEKDNLKNISY